jgi:hypothetical protein
VRARVAEAATDEPNILHIAMPPTAVKWKRFSLDVANSSWLLEILEYYDEDFSGQLGNAICPCSIRLFPAAAFGQGPHGHGRVMLGHSV